MGGFKLFFNAKANLADQAMTTKPPPSAQHGSGDTAATNPKSAASVQAGVPEQAEPAPERVLSPAAERALAEAEARRQARQQESHAAEATEKEIGGRGGADPSRFGDWEINGRAIDF